MSDRLLLLRQLRAQRITRSWLGTSAMVLIGLALAGGAMRLAQASGGNLFSTDTFYEVMSIHGSGMVAVGLMAGAALLWHLVSDEIELSVTVNRFVFLLTLTGLLLILAAVMVFGYSSAWTFLYPLPEHPGSGIATASVGAASYLTGLALVVVGFLLWCVDFIRAGVKRCGSLQRLLGLYVFSESGHGHAEQPDRTTTQPSLIAGTVVAILGLEACLIGALIVVFMLTSLVFPSLTISALVAKNMIYFAGHTLANLQIYVAAGIAYAVLPVYTKRPWRLSRALVAGWLATLAIVMLAFFHHLYQDFAQPEAVQWVGNVASYAAAIPPMTVTIYGGLVQVWRSGIRWSAAALFTFMAMAGWAIGGLGAVIDSTIALNQFLHNTLWVPAHFHTYMALGVMFFIIGAAYHLMPSLTGRHLSEKVGRRAALMMTVGGYVLVLCWYISGSMSAPRRYMYPLSGTEIFAWIAVAGALVALTGALMVFKDVVDAFLAAPRLNLPEPELRPSRLSIVTAVKGGWLAGPILLGVVLSPLVESWSRESLVVHHLAHGLMVVAGALLGYQFSRVERHPWPAPIAWLGLGAALIWHVLPLLNWAEATRTTHVFAHATLVAGGIALGWGVPALSNTAKAYLFIAANVVMWPLVLLQIAGAFSYSAYADQAAAAGLAELAAMSASWLVLAFWSSIRSVFDRAPIATAAQALVVTMAIAGWL